MMLGRVVGEVWATRKCEALRGYKLLVVRPLFWYDPDHDSSHVVAIDTVQAGVGDDVVVCFGEPARSMTSGSCMPCEAAVAAVVDRVALAPSAMPAGMRPLNSIGSLPAGVER
jgi:ethanolamine utilization protein EutN